MAATPPDLQRVLDTIARNATRVCEGLCAVVFRSDGTEIRLAAHHGLSPSGLAALDERYPIAVNDGGLLARAIRTGSVLHFPDLLDDPDIPTWLRDLARAEGYRSLVVVPMVQDRRAVGSLNVSRPEGGFTERQIRLLQTFADQAVIAIENVRLFTELQARNRELTASLEQQTATGVILRVISSSPTDVQPTFDAIAASATRLCEAAQGSVFRFDGTLIHLVAHHGPDPAHHDALRRTFPIPPGRGSVTARAILTRAVVHTNVAEDEEHAYGALVRSGASMVLAVPMLRAGAPIGSITLSRDHGRPFTDTQIALLQTFADQAVIAIENVRLFQALEARNLELTAALEQQTATAEILRVISSSPTDAQPVFDTITKSAVRLSEGLFGCIFRFEEGLLHLAGAHNIPDELMARFRSRFPSRPYRGLLAMRAVLDGVIVQSPDVDQDPEFQNQDITIPLGMRSLIGVPMLRDGTTIGSITVGRRAAGYFPEVQVELLKTFAAQAVIAIENVRLFTELQARNVELTESLEQQTAMAEILRVISSSPADLQRVMDVVAERAAHLCGADNVVAYRLDGWVLRAMAVHGPWPTEEIQLSRGVPSGRAVLDRATIHVPDVRAAGDEYPDAQSRAVRTNTHAILVAPLLRKGEAVGTITMRRDKPGPFSEKQVKLLEIFAAQAVIAIENVRLFQELEARNRDLTESLEQQTATAEILRVISSSPTDLTPVMEVVTRSAARLARADHAMIGEAGTGHIRWLATFGCPLISEGVPISREMPSGRAILDCQTTQVEDVTAGLTADFPQVRRAHDELGVRTILGTPLMREGVAIGVLLVRRTRVQLFAAQEIELLRTFADQAVIAIENVRLFQELQARNRELTESLEQQTATAEILRVISSSPTDVQPVFDSILERAIRLADSMFGSAFSFDGERVHLVAHRGLSDAALALTRHVYPMVPGPEQITARAVLERRVVHVRDVNADPNVSATTREFAKLIGFRSLLAVPMLRDGRAVGVLTITRATGEFSPRHIELVKTFADQAVIAIENVRLFTELDTRNRELTESLEQQTATSEILRAISASPTDTQPVFDTIAQRAVRVCDGTHCVVFRFDGLLVHAVAQSGLSAESVEEVRRIYPLSLSADTLVVRSIREGQVVHDADMLGDASEPVRRQALVGGYRSGIMVPLLRSGIAVGVIAVGRSDPAGGPRPFTEKEIALLQTFADQGVIAVENVRLFQELEARNRELTESLEQQTATAEILRVISSSPTDVHPVFDTIATNAAHVCEAGNANVYRFDGSLIHLVASDGYTAEELFAVKGIFPMPPGRGGATARAVSTGAVSHIPDMSTDPDLAYPALVQAGFRTSLSVPMLRDGQSIGAITVARRETRPFSDRQIALLQTFAAQAVIAVENVRLFTELGARNRELSESLEQQTATAGILQVISGSPTDIQPIFETIARSATTLCEADLSGVHTFDGELIHVGALYGRTPEETRAIERAFPQPPSRLSVTARAILTAAPSRFPITARIPKWPIPSGATGPFSPSR